jgi:preprotein translocase subunit SecA
MAEDEAIEHRLISRALESAQEKIEGFNFDARKHVLEFDDVINHQRTAIYGRRRRLLLGTLDEVAKELDEILGTGIKDGQKVEATNQEREDDIQKIIDKKTAEFGREAFLQAVRVVLLQTIDMYWVEHLEVMDYTRSSVSLRAYGQRDPLVEYKKEGLRLFKEMQNAMREQVVKILRHVVPVQNGAAMSSPETRNLNEVRANAQSIGAGDGSGNSGIRSAGSGIRSAGYGTASSLGDAKKEPGRNDPCPCGSGKKYKNCGLKDTEEHQKLSMAK